LVLIREPYVLLCTPRDKAPSWRPAGRTIVGPLVRARWPAYACRGPWRRRFSIPDGLVTCFATRDGIPAVARAVWRRGCLAAASHRPSRASRSRLPPW